MEILGSGSFVNLEDRTKVEQLIFTAKELANAASRTDGFVSNGDTNQKLALEMWHGAGYVCRGNEDATIKNIFLSNFLQKLKEVTKQIVAPAYSSQESIRSEPLPMQTFPPVLIHPREQVRMTGNVAQTPDLVIELDESKEEPETYYADECVPECDADIEAIVERLDNECPEQVTENSLYVPLDMGGGQPEPSTPTITAIDKPEPITPATLGRSPSNDVVEATVEFLESDAPTPATGGEHTASNEVVEPNIGSDGNNVPEIESIKSIMISEKEPYNFEGCTVTAVIQLLPEAGGVRKCVVSVRTHDFAPLVAIVDVATAEVLSEVSGSLGIVFEQYRNELPARAADKVKKEKAASTRKSKSAAKTSKPMASAQDSDSESSASTESAVDQSQQGLFTA